MQDGRSREPLMWAPSKEDEFNLTELIDSVERKIWLLEEMENRPIAANSLLSLRSESETTEEDLLLLTLPGYKPKRAAAAAARADPSGNLIVGLLRTNGRGRKQSCSQLSRLVLYPLRRLPRQGVHQHCLRSRETAGNRAKSWTALAAIGAPPPLRGDYRHVPMALVVQTQLYPEIAKMSTDVEKNQ